MLKKSALLSLIALLASGCKEESTPLLVAEHNPQKAINLHHWKDSHSKYPVVAFIDNAKLVDQDRNNSYFFSYKLSDNLNICTNDFFANERGLASCGGVLITKRHVLTSLSCIDVIDKIKEDDTIETVAYCPNGLHSKSSKVIFDFKNSKADNSRVVINNQNIFECKKVVAFNKSGYAIIELDRENTHFEPITLNFQNPSKETSLNLIVPMLPEGTALKYASLMNWSFNESLPNNESFKVPLKAYAFRYSQGLPIIDTLSNSVIGISEKPSLYWAFRKNHQLNCFELNTSDEDGQHSKFYPIHTMDNLKSDFENLSID